jgi:hypothetical protein
MLAGLRFGKSGLSLLGSVVMPKRTWPDAGPASIEEIFASTFPLEYSSISFANKKACWQTSRLSFYSIDQTD